MEWKLFADLADLAGGKTIEVDVERDATVGDALEKLLADRPALHDRVLNEEGAILEHVNVLRNGTAVDDKKLDDRLEADDELALFPPMSGG